MERFGKHIKEVEPVQVEIDWEGHPKHGFLGWLVGIGTRIVSRNGYGVGDSDRIVEIDGEQMCFHEKRLK